jgi:hypothetical protein
MKTTLFHLCIVGDFLILPTLILLYRNPPWVVTLIEIVTLIIVSVAIVIFVRAKKSENFFQRRILGFKSENHLEWATAVIMLSYPIFCIVLIIMHVMHKPVLSSPDVVNMGSFWALSSGAAAATSAGHYKKASLAENLHSKAPIELEERLEKILLKTSETSELAMIYLFLGAAMQVVYWFWTLQTAY